MYDREMQSNFGFIAAKVKIFTDHIESHSSIEDYYLKLRELKENFAKNKKTSKRMNKKQLKVEITNKSNSYGHSRTYKYYIDGDCVFVLNQVPYPNCCGIAIFRDLSTYRDIQKDDFISCIDEIILDLQKTDSFTKALIYTTSKSIEAGLFSSFPTITILDSFKNRRSGNMLVGFELDLTRPVDKYVDVEDNEEDIDTSLLDALESLEEQHNGDFITRMDEFSNITGINRSSDNS